MVIFVVNMNLSNSNIQPLDRIRRHVFYMWWIVCLCSPQSELGYSSRFHCKMASVHLPCPVRILFSDSQVALGKSNPRTPILRSCGRSTLFGVYSFQVFFHSFEILEFSMLLTVRVGAFLDFNFVFWADLISSWIGRLGFYDLSKVTPT